MTRRLMDRIPDDVKARAAKAGVTDCDWYAGRLLPEPMSTLTLERERELRARARQIRRDRRRARWHRVTRRAPALNQEQAS